MAAELGLYLFPPFFGYLVDRYSPRPISLVSAVFFGFGYPLAAFTYRAGPPDEGGWPVLVMIISFVAVGMGTCAMYLSAITACVKNFGRGKHKGLALSLPIACFGLSGMWQSQVGSRLLYEPQSDGSRGDVDVFRFFLFLGGSLFVAGILGGIFQKIVDEEELIEEAVEELERSGLLNDSPFFQGLNRDTYGTMTDGADDEDDSRSASTTDKLHENEGKIKNWILNGETRRFLADPTMWFLALGFFLITGPVETYINNFGTIIQTLYPPGSTIPSLNSAATHVSVLALTSTIARVLAGILADLLSPVAPPNPQYRALTPSREESNPFETYTPRSRFTVSRVTLLLSTPVMLFFSFIFLLLPIIPEHPTLFPFVTAVIGLVNGASFSLTPIVISVVWGVQNFATNWGVVAMMPALGAALWSIIYSVDFQAHVGEDGQCFGNACWAGAIGGMAGAAVLAGLSWTWAGWGKGGWKEKGVVV